MAVEAEVSSVSGIDMIDFESSKTRILNESTMCCESAPFHGNTYVKRSANGPKRLSEGGSLITPRYLRDMTVVFHAM